MAEQWDVIVIGAGPAGMAASVYTGRARLRTLILDRVGVGGGQMLNTELIEDYPGFKSISGTDLSMQFEAQLKEFGAEIQYGDVVSITAQGPDRIVRTETGDEYIAKAVIVCTGGQPRRLDVPGEDAFTHRGVTYCSICDGAFFKGEDVVVVGGGDSAVEAATFITRYARKVYLVHRRGTWSAQKVLQERVYEFPQIEPVWHSVIDEIGGGRKVEWVRLRDVRNGELRTVDVGGVFVYAGFTPNSAFLGPEIPRDDFGFVLTDHKMETPVPGIYVAGDLRQQYVRQISNAVGDATTAAVAATRYIEALDSDVDVSIETQLLRAA